MAWARSRSRRAWLTGAPAIGTERWGPPDPVTSAARRERERAHATRYYHALPEDRRAALAAKWTARDQQEYELTRRAAERYKDAWSEAEDCYVLDHPELPAREIGLALGRTNWAVRQRRWRLRRRRTGTGDLGERERARHDRGMANG